MADLIRDAPLGQLIRLGLTKNKYLQYPEEKADFKLPPSMARHGRLTPIRHHQRELQGPRRRPLPASEDDASSAAQSRTQREEEARKLRLQKDENDINNLHRNADGAG